MNEPTPDPRRPIRDEGSVPSAGGTADSVPPVAVRQQLARMLQSQAFAARPRSASLLRFVVEESVRNGLEPLGQRLIAVHGLGLDADFSPTRSAEVRVKVARLRGALARYYAGPGRDDPLVFAISPGPYRLIVSGNGASPHHPGAIAARESRGVLPTLLLVEPIVQGGQPGQQRLVADISLHLGGLLAESTLVNVSGPLPHARIAAATEPPAVVAAALGYEYVAEAEIDTVAPQWMVRMAVSDTRPGRPASAFDSVFEPGGTTPPAEAIAAWMYHRISACFVVRA
jgi:hypothetical protein